MSLSWRILSAFVFVIILAVSLSVAVGFYTTQGQLDTFTDQLGRVEANNLAQNLSRAYTTSGNWDLVDATLAEAGYLYGTEGEGESGGENEGGEHGEGAESEEADSELFHIDRIRIVIVNSAGIVVQDNFALLDPGVPAPTLAGQRTMIVDSNTNQAVGTAYVDVNQEFLATESGGFLRRLLTNSALGGLVIAVIALLLAFWLSSRITAPVTALTKATQMIATQGDTAILPVNSSDELGQMSQAFNQMTAALQTQRNLRKRLINDVAHELNTPLSVIRLEAHGLRKGFQSSELASDQIIQEVNMLQNLVSDLNWMAESELEALRLTTESYSLNTLLTTEVKRWQTQASRSEVHLSLELPTKPILLNLDPMRMSQALGNVITNALQHSEAKGHILVKATASGETITISIIDDGIGIDPADLPHISDRFYRADRSRDRRTGGMGLGLAITQAIVDAHEGRFAIDSKGLGNGTIVRIMLDTKFK